MSWLPRRLVRGGQGSSPVASTGRGLGAWVKIAFAMFAVGWEANQFSPMLIVYRHELRLGAGAVAGLFLVYALTLIPGLLVGGPALDRFGRRPVVWPFVALSPVATLLLVLGPRSLVMVTIGLALAGLCSGVVFGAATAWVQEVSPDDGMSARRSALALTAGFGLGPVVAAALAQWVSDPLAGAVPAPPAHRGSGRGRAGADAGRRAPGPAQAAVRRRWPPAVVRTRRFWLGVALASPMVFGSVSLAIVVLPEEVTSARSLSAGFAGLMTALSFSAGVAVQPSAGDCATCSPAAWPGCAAPRREPRSGSPPWPPPAASWPAPPPCSSAWPTACAWSRGCGRPNTWRTRIERGAVIACYYALAYLGFAAPYLVDGLGALVGQTGAFVALTAIIAGLALWTAGYAARQRRAVRDREGDATCQLAPRRSAIPRHDKVTRRLVRTN